MDANNWVIRCRRGWEYDRRNANDSGGLLVARVRMLRWGGCKTFSWASGLVCVCGGLANEI